MYLMLCFSDLTSEAVRLECHGGVDRAEEQTAASAVHQAAPASPPDCGVFMPKKRSIFWRCSASDVLPRVLRIGSGLACLLPIVLIIARSSLTMKVRLTCSPSCSRLL